MERPRSELGEEEIEAILARLRKEVYGRPFSGRMAGAPSFAAAREEAERSWPVSAERPFLEYPGMAGRARAFAVWGPKVLLRRLLRWYLEPPLTQQRRFNAAVLTLVDELAARTEARNHDSGGGPGSPS